MILASELFHIDCTCLILALHRLAQLRCLLISWLDHRRLQANKLRTSMSNQTNSDCRLPSRHFLTLNLLPRYRAAMVINPIARLNFLFDNIMFILSRQHVVYRYLSFECRQRTIMAGLNEDDYLFSIRVCLFRSI